MNPTNFQHLLQHLENKFNENETWQEAEIVKIACVGTDKFKVFLNGDYYLNPSHENGYWTKDELTILIENSGLFYKSINA